MNFIETYENNLVYIGIGGLMAFMAFIIWDLAKQSNAGKWGTAVLFFSLGLGMVGLIIKAIIIKIMTP